MTTPEMKQPRSDIPNLVKSNYSLKPIKKEGKKENLRHVPFENNNIKEVRTLFKYIY
jgi:hypothetical protein